MSRGGWIVFWIIVLIIVVGGFLYIAHRSPTPNSIVSTTSNSTPSTTTPSTATVSQTVVHLDVYVHDAAQPIPAMSTTTASGEAITTASDGVVTFSPSVSGQTLGQIFQALGEQLTPTCFGQYCASETDSFRVYVNGQLYQGDPSQIPLTNGDEIAIVYGTTSEIPNPIPSSYTFSSGD